MINCCFDCAQNFPPRSDAKTLEFWKQVTKKCTVLSKFIAENGNFFGGVDSTFKIGDANCLLHWTECWTQIVTTGSSTPFKVRTDADWKIMQTAIASTAASYDEKTARNKLTQVLNVCPCRGEDGAALPPPDVKAMGKDDVVKMLTEKLIQQDKQGHADSEAKFTSFLDGVVKVGSDHDAGTARDSASDAAGVGETLAALDRHFEIRGCLIVNFLGCNIKLHQPIKCEVVKTCKGVNL